MMPLRCTAGDWSKEKAAVARVEWTLSHYGLTPTAALLPETELPGSRLTIRGGRYHLSSRPARFRFPQEFSLPNPPANSIDRG